MDPLLTALSLSDTFPSRFSHLSLFFSFIVVNSIMNHLTNAQKTNDSRLSTLACHFPFLLFLSLLFPPSFRSCVLLLTTPSESGQVCILPVPVPLRRSLCSCTLFFFRNRNRNRNPKSKLQLRSCSVHACCSVRCHDLLGCDPGPDSCLRSLLGPQLISHISQLAAHSPQLTASPKSEIQR